MLKSKQFLRSSKKRWRLLLQSSVFQLSSDYPLNRILSRTFIRIPKFGFQRLVLLKYMDIYEYANIELDIEAFCIFTFIWLASKSLKSAYIKNAIWCNLKKSHTHVKKVGHTSVWNLLINLKNNYLLKKLLKWANKKCKNFNIQNVLF